MEERPKTAEQLNRERGLAKIGKESTAIEKAYRRGNIIGINCGRKNSIGKLN